MENASRLIYNVLFDWAKLQYQLSNKSDNEDDLKNSIHKREEYLSKYGIEQIALLHKSTDYYNIKYMHDGRPCIKQFKTEDIEH